MADRSVVVRLRAEISEYKARLKEAAAVTAGFKKDVDGAGDDVDGLGKKSRTAGAEVDRLSGRLAILRDVALTIGPAFVPIGAAAIPVVTGLAAALGATVIGVGTAVAAFQGFGDALEAVRTAELEPTAENLQAAREALEGLDPAAAALVQQFNDLVPQLKEIRDAGAAEFMPGISEGIDALEKRLPLLERMSASVGEVLGDNAASAGQSLASGRWGPFLRFLEDEAPTALNSVISIVGNLAHGVAELWMAFDPLNDSVIGGLERGAAAFDQWASKLSQTDGFEGFVDYIETTGPQVVDTLASIGDAIVKLLQALAPLGGPSLALIRGFAEAVGMLASSDLGGPLLTAAAAWAAYNRAAAIGLSLTKRFGLASAATPVGGAGAGGDDSSKSSKKKSSKDVSASAARGGEIVAAVAGAALFVDEIQSDYEGLNATLGDTKKALAEIAAGQISQLGGDFEGLSDSFERLTDPGKLQALQTTAADFLGGGDDDDVYKARDQFVAIDDALSDIAQNDGAEAGRAAFESLATALGLSGDKVKDLQGLLPGYGAAMDAADAAAKDAAGGVDEFGNKLDENGEKVRKFSTALAELNGWLDRRAALRGYRESVSDLSNALKDGFQPKDAETIDNVGRAITQVAEGIKDKSVRAEFLSGARASLLDIAENSGPRASAEVQNLVGAMDKAGVTRPPIPLTVETANALQRITGVGSVLDALSRRRATPRVDAETAAAIAAITGVGNRLAGLKNKTLYITTVERRVGPGGQGKGYDPSAMGNIFPEVRAWRAFAMGGYGDQANAHQPELAGPGVTRMWREPETQGEAYIPLANDYRRGRAKNILDDVAARFGGEVEWYATGGDTDKGKGKRRRPSRDILVDEDDPRVQSAGLKGQARVDFLKDFAKDARKGLRKLEKSSEDASDAVDQNKDSVSRETKARDDLQRAFNDLVADIADQFRTELFDPISDVWRSASMTADPISVLRGDIAAAEQYQTLFGGLVGRGLDGGALEHAAQQGTDALSVLTAYTDAQLQEFESLFNQRESVAIGVGTAVAQQQYADQLANANYYAAQSEQRLAEANRQLASIEAAVRQQDRTAEQAGKVAAAATKQLASSAAKGARARKKKG